MVLAPDGIAAPVVADFDATPVAADELLPLLQGAFLGGKTGQVVAGLGRGLAGFLYRDFAVHDDEAAHEGEVGGGRFQGEDGELADFDTAVPEGGLGKKRAPGWAAQAWAWASRPGWLPLI